MGGRDPELSPLVEMAMGIRSKYEDANFTYYEGYFNPAGFHLTAVHDYGISCRWLHDYGPERDAYTFDRWSIHRDSPKTQLVNTTVAFSLLKSDQSGRSLLVFAGDSQYPGYFKAFGANAQSDVVMSPSLCIHESDMDCDNCVSRTELFAFIDLWYVNSSDPTLKELIEAIGLWKMGSCP